MKSISLSVYPEDYEEFRRVAEQEGRSIAQLIREAMAHYRKSVLASRTVLRDVPVLVGPRPVGSLPSRDELYDEVFDRRSRAADRER